VSEIRKYNLQGSGGIVSKQGGLRAAPIAQEPEECKDHGKLS
jgi:hypothetical protein